MGITFGVQTQTWFSGAAAQKIYDAVPRAAKLGFAMLEILFTDTEVPFDPRELRKRLDDAGLAVAMCAALPAKYDISSTDKRVVDTGVAYFTSAARTAETLGARFFCGPLYAELYRGRWMSGADRRAEWERGVAGLKTVGKICGDHGLTIAVEPLNRFETDFLNTAHDAVRLVEAVGSPNVKIHLDTFHMNVEEKSLGGAIREAGKHLVHFHACGNDRGAPGSDHVPWAEVAGALKEIRYGGAIVIEGFNPEDHDISNGARIWRPVGSSQDAVAADGLAFLKKLFA
jgi:D-psicose/D-tagatose/L-ribulose 3-epimerase